jgi:nickel transport protein
MGRHLTVCAGLLLVTARAEAHALHAEARLKGDRVTVEAFYSDNTPAQNARIVVANKKGVEIASGRTDESGTWEFPRPKGGSYEVAVDAGEGHRARVPIAIPSDPSIGAESRNSDDGGVVVTAGPTRAELTRMPWLRVIIGLGAIAALAGALWLATRRGNTGEGQPPVQLQ